MGKSKRMFYHKERGLRITALMCRDGCECALCGESLDRKVKDPFSPTYITFDHKVPRSAGGTDELSNMQLAHRKCNEARGADPLFLEEQVA